MVDVALGHFAEAGDGAGFFAQALRSVAHCIEVEVEADHARTPAQHAEAVASFAATCVEN